ncbi:WXG100 family type VII secretion target [Fictibacillus sp. KIGAM418]|uniref:WXG100 family type VII secretion target n=1 Tax=Fictibacillus marinisediminis TaxID=2878389 RepID=A0A9X2BEQ3_9BACL|nr:WXG100 family type VII secretion target [Fictibacillus marinisediminis]MCK6256347.1 WXG100 family type VII secretion target [Fictibacillus marinisediminis]
MSRVNVKPDELKALASDVGKLAAQSNKIKANLQLNYYSMQSNGQGINLSAISPLYNSLIQQMEHYGTLLHSAQDVVKKTETKFREADQQLFSADGFTSFLSGTLFATVKQGASSLSKGIKYGKVTAALSISQYLKWKYNFNAVFDPAGRKGKGAYTLSARNRKDLVKIGKMLKLNKDDDAFVKFIRNGFKFEDLKTSRSQIKKAKASIYKLPDFVAHQEFKMDQSKIGNFGAMKTQAWKSFKSSYADSAKNLNPMKWKEAFKEVGKAGKTLKGLAVVGSVLSVGGNIIESQKDGFQAMDTVDVVTDSAVDMGSISAAAATGAAFGSFIAPPAGTVAGAVIGMGASYLMNEKIFGGESVVSGTKKAIKGVTHKLASVFW